MRACGAMGACVWNGHWSVAWSHDVVGQLWLVDDKRPVYGKWLCTAGVTLNRTGFTILSWRMTSKIFHDLLLTRSDLWRHIGKIRFDPLIQWFSELVTSWHMFGGGCELYLFCHNMLLWALLWVFVLYINMIWYDIQRLNVSHNRATYNQRINQTVSMIDVTWLVAVYLYIVSRSRMMTIYIRHSSYDRIRCCSVFLIFLLS